MIVAASAKTNWFAIWVTAAAVVVVAALAVLVIWMNARATAPGEAPSAANVNSKTGAITFGDGPDTLGTFIDFMCEYCQAFEQNFGDPIDTALASGDLTLEITPIAILDRASQGTDFSSRAANAMYVISIGDPKNAIAFMQAMYDNKPNENTTGLSNDEIIKLAEDNGVKMTDAMRTDITSGRYMDFVKANTANTPVQPGAQGIATPTITVNGKVIANSELPSNPADLMTLFD